MGTLIEVTGGARKAISMDSLIGNRLAGRYDIQSWIGQGGMGIVYRGHDVMLKRVVAIKVLPLQLTIDPAFVQRFRQEAVIAANLRHSNIVTIYDVGTQPGDRPELSVYYIVMEYLEGVTLDQWIAQNGSMTSEQVSHVVGQVAEALDYAHEQGLIHRDIKPSNIMIGPKGKATLMDFGLVRAGESGGLTRNSVIMGTPEYMAPEQALGQSIDSRADTYSLGAVIYKLFIGSAPFVRSTPMAVAVAHAYEPPVPPRSLRPDLPKPVEAVMMKALAKKPAERYQRAGDLARDLALAVTGKMPAGLKALPTPPSGSPRASVLAVGAAAGTPKGSPLPQAVLETQLVQRGQTPAGGPKPAATAEPVAALTAQGAQRSRRSLPSGLLLTAIGGLAVVILAGAAWALSSAGSNAPRLVAATTTVLPTPVLMAAKDTPTTVAATATSKPPHTPATVVEPEAAPTATRILIATLTRTNTPTAPLEPTATSLATSQPRATSPPAKTPTKQPATPVPTRTPISTRELTPVTATTPKPTNTLKPQTGQVVPAPQLSQPADGQRFEGPISDVVLRWQPVALPEGACYVVTVRFRHIADTWTDVHCLSETQIALPAYLADTATDARFEWQVTVMRPKSNEFTSEADGEPLSSPSSPRTLFWASSGSSDGGTAPPTRPAPSPEPTRP